MRICEIYQMIVLCCSLKIKAKYSANSLTKHCNLKILDYFKMSLAHWIDTRLLWQPYPWASLTWRARLWLSRNISLLSRNISQANSFFRGKVSWRGARNLSHLLLVPVSAAVVEVAVEPWIRILRINLIFWPQFNLCIVLSIEPELVSSRASVEAEEQWEATCEEQLAEEAARQALEPEITK